MTLNKTLILFCLLATSFNSLFASYSGTGTFTKVTTLADLENGAYYVLYGVNGTYEGALSNTLSSGKFTATTVSVSSDKITDPDATIVWRLDANASNWNLYNEAASVYGEITVNSTSGFTANTTASSSYSVSVSGGNFQFMDATISRGISLYQADFRPYASSSMKELYLYKLQVSSAPIATPSITPSSQKVYGDDLSVSISTYGTDTTVYYTTDGTAPTSASSVYTAPFSVNSTTTVKAIAIAKSGDESNAAAATYTFATKVNDIATFLSANSSATTNLYKITGAVTVTYQKGSRLFVTDASGDLLIYGSTSETYTNGQTLTGIYGKYSLYYGTHEFIPDSIPSAVSGTKVSPTVMTIPTITTADQSKLIKIELAKVDTTKKAFVVGTDSIPYSDSFGVMTATYDSNTEYYILGVVSVYNSAPSLYPIAVSTDPNPSASIAESESVESSVIAGKGFVNVSLTEEAMINVYSLNGYKAASLKGTEGTTTISLAEGIYIVTVGNTATKVIVK